MKNRSRWGTLAGALIGTSVLFACSSSPPPDEPSDRTAPESSRSSLSNISSMLSGNYQGTTPGNGLRLDFSTLGGRGGTRFDVFVTAVGRYRDRNIRRVGLLRLETQGRTVHAVYVPHFDSTVTPLSREAMRFSEDELRSACDLYFAPSGDGYAGETRGASTCAQAIPGAVGKWTVEVDPGGIRIRNVGSGETLRFARTK
jgi:hypothetical protein